MRILSAFYSVIFCVSVSWLAELEDFEGREAAENRSKSKSNRMLTASKSLQKRCASTSSKVRQLGWLIDPDAKSVEIYRPAGKMEKRGGIEKIEGEGSVAGFVLDLKYVWDPLAD